ncbi:TPA: phosphoglycolate phosphatase [candidate division WOR-3 bacterium]|jgi:phosphoglycolate phosphatase|uniref:Phosphoglycolate phosphatase n=1 Tax=candidate division WOR-3 bacterium TaxID=2052148 RepID=A0A350HB25_UNCW3|nr:phosphoglycolate phosphatase [candidate division WOR-3 bacterium]
MRTKEYCGVLFDLDGTITDSKEGILDSLEYSLKNTEAAGMSRESLQDYIGEPLKIIYGEIFKTDDSKIIDEAIVRYRDYFARKGISNNKVYPHISSLLMNIRKERKMVFLTTIKPRIYARRILEMYGLLDYFTDVFGSEMDGRNSTKKELISLALEKWKKKCGGNLLMVGDRDSDIEGAEQNNLDSVGVKYGYSKPKEIENAHPTYIAETPEELLILFKKLKLIRGDI